MNFNFKIFLRIFRKIPFRLQTLVKLLFYKIGIIFDEIYLVYDLVKHRKLNKKTLVIDVGANIGNSSAPFVYSKNPVIAIEPDPRNIKRLEKNFGNKANFTLKKCAISDKNQSEAPFNLSDITSINSLYKFHESHKTVINVEIKTLDQVIKEESVKYITFLKIDVEGYDLFALKSLSLNPQIKPDLILIEFEDKKTIPLGYTYKDVVDYLKKNSYDFITFEYYPINKYGENHKISNIKINNKEIENPDGWGNILAFKNNKDLQKAITRINKTKLKKVFTSQYIK